MDGDAAAVDGDMTVDGVAGTGAPIRLEFLAPGGARTGRLLPTGKPSDVLEVDGLGRIPASMVDAANPVVYVPADAIGATRNRDAGRDRTGQAACCGMLEAIRRAASVAMGIAPDLEAAGPLSGPGIAFVRPADRHDHALWPRPRPSDMDIAVRVISNGQPHRATPLTGALCLSVATRHRRVDPKRNGERPGPEDGAGSASATPPA